MTTATAVAVVMAGVSVAPAAAQEVPTVTLTAPADGARVTGTVRVSARAVLIDDVELEISTDGGGTWKALQAQRDGDVWRGSWDSTSYDGSAVVRARSWLTTAVDRARVQVDNTAPTVTVVSDRSSFSPLRHRALLTVDVNEPALLVVEVRNRAGATVSRWQVDTARTTLRVRWNGRRNGRVLPDGRYRVRAVATDAVGLQRSVGTPLRIDTTAPRARLRVPRVVDATSPLPVRYRIRDAASVVRIRMRVLDSAGRRVVERHVTRRVGRGVASVATRYRSGDRLFPGGYRLVAQVKDDAGNARRLVRRFAVHRAAPARVFTRLEGTGRRVALTFDDCNFEGSWHDILDTLARHDAKATFFCPGDRVDLAQDAARRTVRAGHTVAAHAWGHPMLTSVGYGGTVDRLARDRRAWARVGGVSAPYMRPPYGAYSGSVVKAAGVSSHPRVMMWDIDSGDTAGATGATLVCNVVCEAQPGSVILMHVKPETAAALPAIIRGLRARNLDPVSLPRLFRAAGMR